MGFIGPDLRNPFVKSDYTNYATLRVPKTGFFAFRSYFDMQWKIIDLAHLDFTRDLFFVLPGQGSASERTMNMANITGDINAMAAGSVTESAAAARKGSFLQRAPAGDDSAFPPGFFAPSDRSEI